MARRLPSTCIWLVPALLCLSLAAGCGGDAGTTVKTPPPPVGNGPAVRGAVFMPNGQLSQRASLLERFASIGVREAEALAAANIIAVGRNVEVRVWQSGSPVQLGTVFTQDQGIYRFDLPVNVTADACPRLLVAVGSGSTETRAFVYDTAGSVDIDYQSEAAVRLIENQIATTPGATTCSYSPGQIRDVVAAIRADQSFVPGTSTGQLNQNAFEVARASEQVMEKVEAPFQTATPTSGPTTPLPTRTFTMEPTAVTPPTNTRTPTVTFTRVPTSTPTQVRSATSTPTGGVTPPTSTPTQVTPPSSTPTTGVTPPTSTPTTGVTPPTNTPTEVVSPTNTPTQVSTPTEVVSPTNTPTVVLVPTNTATSPPAPTPTPTTGTGGVPRVDIGSASGAAGSQVTVRFTLANSGGNILLISPLQVRFNNSALSIATDACTSLVSGKTPQAAFPQPDLLSVFFGGGTAVIPNGAFMDCTVNIAAGAAPGDYALTFVKAGMTDGVSDIDATGTNGKITVSGGGGVPRVDIGSASGAAGSQVTVRFTLANSGGDILLISPLQMRFNNAVLSIATDACTSLVSGKTPQAAFPQADLMSVFFGGGTAVIPNGAFMDCTVNIAAGAAPGDYALTFVKAGMTDGVSDIDATGTNGKVTVQ